MATRATYKFTELHAPTTCVYLHWDGYFQGAAEYFRFALERASGANFATDFIHANKNAELTQGHDAHGDTEYRYNIDGKGKEAKLEGYQRVGGFSLTDKPRFALKFSGTIEEFLRLYGKQEEEEKKSI